MRETVRNAERWTAESETWRCAAFCGRRDVTERSDRPPADRRRWRRDFRQSSWARRNCCCRPRAAADGPPTDSEHAKCCHRRRGNQFVVAEVVPDVRKSRILSTNCDSETW